MPNEISSDPEMESRGRGPEAGGQVVRNSTYNLTGQVVYAILYVTAIFILARVLGSDGFGRYFTLFALILIVQLIVEAGAGMLLTRRLIEERCDQKETLRQAISLFATITLTSAATLLAIGLVWSQLWPEPGILLAFGASALACASLQLQRFCFAVFQSLDQFGMENVARVLQGALFTGLILLLAEAGRTQVAEVVFILAGSHLIAALFLILALQRQTSFLSAGVGRPRLRSWLSEALPLGFGDMTRGLTWQLDTVLLGLLQPPAVVGIYSIAYRPLGPLNWIPRAILTALFPSWTRLASSDQRELRQFFSRSTRILWIVSLPITIAIFSFAETLILILAGPEYLEAVTPMRILIWITVLSFISMQFRFLFMALGKQADYARLVVKVFLLELILELALIPRWGYLGACVGSLVGELTFVAAGLMFCYRLGVCRLEWARLGRAAVAGFAFGLLLLPVSGLGILYMAVSGITASLFYIGICMKFGAIQTGEIRHVLEVWRGLFRSPSGAAGSDLVRRSP